MANKYFSQLTQLAAGSVASGDVIAIEDISAGETKYITSSDYATYVSSTLAASSGGWDAVADTWAYLGTYSGGGTVSVPAGGTLLYNKGDKVKFTQGGTQLYFYVIDVGGTTLKITGGSDYALGTATISSVYYSKSENPLDFPGWFNWTVTHTGFSVNPTYIARFCINGKKLHFEYSVTVPGTSNAVGYTISTPVIAATIAGMTWQNAISYVTNNGASGASGVAQIASGGGGATLYTSAAGAWANANGKGAYFQMDYEI